DRTIAQTRTLYVNSWGGSFTAAQDAAYFKPFTALTGIQIRTVTPVSYAKIKAQVLAGRYEFDMTSINSMQWLRASREGLAEPIDWTIFKKGTLPPDAIVATGHGVASNIQGTNLCYRRDKFPNGGPRSWADFWDVKTFPGARGLCINDSPRTLIFALLADGVPADRLYPLDIDRAFKKLDQIKPHIKVWWRGGNQSQPLNRDGEVDIWRGRYDVDLEWTRDRAEGGGGASRAHLERRSPQHEHVVRAQGRAQPQARVGIHPVRRATQAAGRVQPAALLRPDQSGGVRIHPARHRGRASHLQRESRRFDPGGRRMGGGPDRRARRALHAVAPPPEAGCLGLKDAC